MFTVQEAQAWAENNKQELERSLANDKTVPEMMKRVELIQNVWNSGCWLGEVLGQMGADKNERQNILFAHGQRSFGNDAWKVAVRYANEYEQTGRTKEQPGAELAEKIMKEMIKS